MLLWRLRRDQKGRWRSVWDRVSQAQRVWQISSVDAVVQELLSRVIAEAIVALTEEGGTGERKP